jgi:hypothetical protein
MAAVPNRKVQEQAVESTRRLRRKRAAAPDWADYVHKFGEQGARRNAAGKIVGYQMPKPADPEKQRRINREVYEMWGPHRRVATEIGAENSAAVPVVRMRNAKTGVVGMIPGAAAARKVASGKLVEPAMQLGGSGVLRYQDGRYWRRERGEWVPCEPPPSRFHEIVESGQAPAGFVH